MTLASVVNKVQARRVTNYPLLSCPFLFSALLAANLAFAAAALSTGNAEPLAEVMVLVLLPTLDIRLDDRPRVAIEGLTIGLKIASDGSIFAGLDVRSTSAGCGELMIGLRLCVWWSGDDMLD